MRHLWNGLRIRLRSHAACPEAGRAFGQSRRVQELKIQKTVNTRLFEILPFERRKGWGGLGFEARERNPVLSGIEGTCCMHGNSRFLAAGAVRNDRGSKVG